MLLKLPMAIASFILITIYRSKKDEYEKLKEELAQTISQEKQNAVFGDFLAQLRVASGLIDNVPELRVTAQ